MVHVLITGPDSTTGKEPLDLGADFACISLKGSDKQALFPRINRLFPDVVLVSPVPSFKAMTRTIKRRYRLPVIGLLDKNTGVTPPVDPNLDDIIFTPCDNHELSFRIKRILETGNVTEDKAIRIDNLVITPTTRQVSVDSVQVKLTFREYELLKFLSSQRGRVYSRQDLLREVWGRDFSGGPRTVDVHMRRIRSKLPQLDLIQTVRRVGYCMKN